MHLVSMCDNGVYSCHKMIMHVSNCLFVKKKKIMMSNLNSLISYLLYLVTLVMHPCTNVNIVYMICLHRNHVNNRVTVLYSKKLYLQGILLS